MRQVFLQKGALTVGRVSKPVLDDHSLLVMVYYSFVSSGTELATLSHAKESVFFSNVPQKIKKIVESIATNGVEGTKALIQSKLKGEVQALGYSCSGVVIATGKNIKRIRVGDFVACAGAGYAHHADIVCVPENLVAVVKEQKDLKTASVTTIGAIALQGIRRAQVQLGETIAVIGLGLLGQLTVQLAKRAGCRVVGIDVLDERLALARACGADLVVRADQADIQKEIGYYTDQHGVDTTIVTAAAQTNTIMQQAMEITRKKGRVVLVGDVGLDLERNPLYAKEIDFLISCSYGPGRYDHSYEQQGNDYPYAYVRWTENRNMQAIVDLIERNQLDIASLITQEFGVEHVEQAYACLKEKKGLGVVLSYCSGQAVAVEQGPKPSKQSNSLRFIPAIKDDVRVGIVGAGGFAKVRLMPIIANMKKVSIKVVVDTDARTSRNASQLYGAAYTLADDAQLFQDDLVDVVVIASPHIFHCDQALRALEKGKAVFMEKPMVTDFEQFDRLMGFIEKHPQIPFCVGYNRSFSPFMQKIKKVVQKRKTPLALHYRMNAGFIPKEHWIQTKVGAGRIIGEACHIFDLFCFLTDAQPRAVSVEALHAGNTSVFPTDNVSVQISFSDGSICSLLYTALGHKDLGKERMELFFDSKSIVMDDYEYLAGFGFPKSFDETLSEQDKGHAMLLNQFFAHVKKESSTPPIPIERLSMVARITLLVDQLACEGGGTYEW